MRLVWAVNALQEEYASPDVYVAREAERPGRGQERRHYPAHLQGGLPTHRSGYLLNNPGGSSGRSPTVPVVARSGDRPQQASGFSIIWGIQRRPVRFPVENSQARRASSKT